MRGENVRFWLPAVLLALFAAYCSQKLVRTHVSVDERIKVPVYGFEKKLPARRGSIYVAGGQGSPLVKSVPFWEYHLDPVALTNRVVRPKGEKRPRKPEAIVRTIADALGRSYTNVLAMSRNSSKRYQPLGVSSDPEAHAVLANSRYVSGVVIEDRQVRQYPNVPRLSHVIGSVNAFGEASAGIELRYDRELTGVPGLIRGKRDARGNELYDKREEEIAPIPGADVYLTIDRNVQYEAECALKWGVAEYGAETGWCVVLDARTGAVLALASYPDFRPMQYGRATDLQKVNRVVNFTYEPGSVMKVITACAAIDAGIVGPDSLYATNRKDERYIGGLPGDGTHVWEPRMTVRDAIVHSSNIVIGKLGYDLGPKRLWTTMKAFGFGERTGIELPGEERGLLRAWERWDHQTWSRAPIGQGVSVTAMQLATAYLAIANDGERIAPYVVDRVVAADGTVTPHRPAAPVRVVSRATSRTVREMMLGVASPGGTARRGAIRGYSIAGKTGTAQKVKNGKYAPGLYRATFCGIVPSGVVKRDEADPAPLPPRLVTLVTLDFEQKTKFHQGGNSAAPVFRRITTAALRYYAVEPDRPAELMEYIDDDYFDAIMDERAKALGESAFESDPEFD